MESKSSHLGVTRSSKSIKKSPLHQPSNFLHLPSTAAPPSDPPPPPPQPQVYNISKNDFRSLVQQLTSHNPPINPPIPNFNTPQRHQNPSFNTPPPPQNHNFNFPQRPPPPKPASQRLQKIRPPPLAPIARPPPAAPANANFNPSFNPNPNFNYSHNPNPNHGFNQNTSFGRPPAESPVTAYMRYLESSIMNSDGSSGRPPVPPLLPSPRGNPLPFPSPRGAPPLPPWPTPPHSPALLPSPLLSPSAFLNLASPYPLLSPGFQYPPPLTPNFAFSGSGILGPGPGAPPLSPGLMFPQSPSAFLLSPRWREM